MDQITSEMVQAIASAAERSPGDGPVVLGVSDDPLDEQRAAVDFAVAEANRRGADLWLVHGCEQLMTLTAIASTATAAERFHAGQEIVQAVGDYAGGLLDPDRRMASQVSPATGAQALVNLSEAASLVVCGRREVSTARRWHTGSTTSRVCAQSHAPVAVVRPATDRADAQGVVVGVDGHGHSAVAIETAFREAILRDRELIAVHAWQVPGPPEATGYISADPDELKLLHDQAKARLAEAMAGPSTEHSGVPASQRAVRGPAASALVDASRSAELVVVGRHAGHAVGSLGLGSVARHLLGHAHSPVIVTPTSRPAHRFGIGKSASPERQPASTAPR